MYVCEKNFCLFLKLPTCSIAARKRFDAGSRRDNCPQCERGNSFEYHGPILIAPFERACEIARRALINRSLTVAVLIQTYGIAH